MKTPLTGPALCVLATLSCPLVAQQFRTDRALDVSPETRVLGISDLDGDPDLLTPFGTLRNHHRQLRLPRPPQVRSTTSAVELEASIAPGYGTTPGFAFVAYSFGLSSQPLVAPGLGTVYLDLPTLASAGAVVVPVAGDATLGIPLPADPNLVGLEVHFQALLESGSVPAQLSNLVSTRIQ